MSTPALKAHWKMSHPLISGKREKSGFSEGLALHSSKLRSSRQEPVRRYLLATHPRPKKTRFRKDGRIAGMRKSGRGRVGDKDFREEMGDEETKTGGEAARRIREFDRLVRSSCYVKLLSLQSPSTICET